MQLYPLIEGLYVEAFLFAVLSADSNKQMGVHCVF